MEQITDTVLMIRPKHFNYNPETAESNVFQHIADFANEDALMDQVLKEFDSMVNGLKEKGIQVVLIEDTFLPPKYDAIFPNNWFTSHEDGSIILYPMMSENRRAERRENVVEMLMENYPFSKLYDFSLFEQEGKFLEGTGSMILDRANKMAYCAVSPRSNLHVLDKFCVLKGFGSTFFHSYDKDDQLIYHTNVMMSIGDGFALVCYESIKDQDERTKLVKQLERSGKEIIEISLDQVYAFCGNCLQLKNSSGDKFIVFSKTAYNALDRSQKDCLRTYGEPLIFDIDTIELVGGGSVRCMLAEMFIPA
jgi:hypothetical protein